MNKRKRVKVFLCERIPSENRGEAAILEGLYNGLKKYFVDFELIIYSMRKKQDTYYYQQKGLAEVTGYDYKGAEESGFLVKLSRLYLFFSLVMSSLLKKIGFTVEFPGEINSHFYESDILLQGHDNVYRNRIKLKDAVVTFFASSHKKLIIIPGASVGPLDSLVGVHKLIAHYVLKNASLITLREAYSGQYIAEKFPNIKATVLNDLAFMLKPQPIDAEFLASDQIIGFTPTKYVLNNLVERGNELTPQTASKKISEYLDWLQLQWPEMKILMIPHVYGPELKQDDRLLIDQIVSHCKRTSNLIVLEEPYTAGELKYIISKLRYLVACRTHSLIAALAEGVPVLALTDKGRYKTNGILGEIFNLPELLFYVENWDLDELKALTKHVNNNVLELGNKVAKSIPISKDLADKNIELIKRLWDET